MSSMNLVTFCLQEYVPKMLFSKACYFPITEYSHFDFYEQENEKRLSYTYLVTYDNPTIGFTSCCWFVDLEKSENILNLKEKNNKCVGLLYVKQVPSILCSILILIDIYLYINSDFWLVRGLLLSFLYWRNCRTNLRCYPTCCHLFAKKSEIL